MAKNTHKKHIFSAVMAIAIAISSLVAVPASAANNYIQISPTKEEVELDPGDSYSGEVRVQNVGDNSFSYKMSATSFTYDDENYNISVGTTPPNKVYTQINDWVTFSKDSGSLEPQTKETIEYTINVPEDAPGGGQYFAIIATVSSEEPASNNNNSVLIKAVSQVADLIFATVNGDTNECAKILNTNINTFMFEPPISATSLVENCGNVHINAEYTLKVYPLFSDKEVYSNVENPETHYIVPETRRFNTQSWTKEQGAPMMGIYTVEQTVKAGKDTNTLKKLVFVFPLWLVIVFILFIGAVVFWLASRSRQRKDAKRRNASARAAASAPTAKPEKSSTSSDSKASD